jgi:hypothetical protein
VRGESHRSYPEALFAYIVAPRGAKASHTILSTEETNGGRGKSALACFRRLSRAWVWSNRGPQSSAFRLAYDYWMTLVIHTRATEGMQDSATAALEVTLSRSGC